MNHEIMGSSLEVEIGGGSGGGSSDGREGVLAMILRVQTLVLSPALSMMVDQLRKLHAFLPDGLLASSQAYASEFCRKEHQALEISLIYVKENKGAATVASTEAWSDTKIEGERLISVVHF
uniref:Uncharacterized protein n=1 Tax=Oryza barthii TaxID=65489 RepID=A0A0D3GZ32_9ORYZ